MNTERSDAEYIVIGKIAEKRKELWKLKEELQALEEARNSTVVEEDVFESIEEMTTIMLQMYRVAMCLCLAMIKR